jgi:sulfate adenylyltransferase
VLIHQVLGALKPGDIPAEVRVAAIDTLVENYFLPGTVIQAGYPIEMRYAGPREALLHALFRQNFGCSHLVVGRDHAGVGDFYGPFDAHHIFDEIPEGSLKTQPLKIDITFYCHKCHGMATGRTCPHGKCSPTTRRCRWNSAAPRCSKCSRHITTTKAGADTKGHQ